MQAQPVYEAYHGAVEKWLTSVAVCRRAGVSFRSLAAWVSAGVLVPARPGNATERRWDPSQVPVVRAVGRLAAMGAPVEALRPAGQWLARLPVALWDQRLVVNTDGLICAPDEAGAGWLLDLATCRDRTEALALAV